MSKNNSSLNSFKKFVVLSKHEIILVLLIVIYIFYFTLSSFLRYDNFYAGRFDLGNMDQTVWNTIHGRFFQASNDNGSAISRLSTHADFMLVLLSPFYFIWQSPKMLLLIQTIVLSSGALFIFLIASVLLKNKNFALIFGSVFLIYPQVEHANLYDFHAVTLATALLLACFYFLIKQKYFWLTIFLILSGIAKEQVWIITALFGLYMLLPNKVPPLKWNLAKKRILGIIIFAISIFLFYFLIWHVIPQNLGTHHFALSYYSDFGDSEARVIKNVLFSPYKLVSIISERSRLEYLKQIFMPLGFISLLSPLFLIFTIPDLLINLLSNNTQLHQIYYHYTSTITPFVFVSAIFAVKQFTKWFPKFPKLYIAFYLIASSIISSYLFGPMFLAKNPNTDMFTKPLPQKEIIENFLLSIPEKYSVASTNNLGAHLSHRQKIFTIPLGVDKADYILFLLNDQSAQPSLKFQKNLASKLVLNNNYIQIFRNGDFIAFRKRAN